MSNAKKPKGLREALRKRHVNTTTYRLPQVPMQVAQERAQALSLAKSTLTAAEFLLHREDRPDIRHAMAEAQQAVTAAQAAYDECFYDIVIAGLPEDDFDALVNEHPPTQVQVEQAPADDAPLYNEATFIPALLAVCAQGAGLSAGEWADELAQWTKGERADIRAKALEANVRTYSASIPFG